MDTLSYKTLSATPETIQKKWIVIDATDQVLGRLCSKVAKILRGKNKADYTPYMDCGDYVIIINADKVLLNGGKMDKHEYLRYTGYPGGQRTFTPGDLMKKSFKVTMKGKHPLHQSCKRHASQNQAWRKAAHQPARVQRSGSSLRRQEPRSI